MELNPSNSDLQSEIKEVKRPFLFHFYEKTKSVVQKHSQMSNSRTNFLLNNYFPIRFLFTESTTDMIFFSTGLKREKKN